MLASPVAMARSSGQFGERLKVGSGSATGRDSPSEGPALTAVHLCVSSDLQPPPSKAGGLGVAPWLPGQLPGRKGTQFHARWVE